MAAATCTSNTFEMTDTHACSKSRDGVSGAYLLNPLDRRLRLKHLVNLTRVAGESAAAAANPAVAGERGGEAGGRDLLRVGQVIPAIRVRLKIIRNARRQNGGKYQ